LVSPTRVATDVGRIVAVECIRNKLGSMDPDGRRAPIGVSGTVFSVEASALIVAAGQRLDVSLLAGSCLTLSERGGIVVEEETGRACGLPIFAGGDAVRGPAFIVDACADGRRAAEAICDELGVRFRAPSRPSLDLSEEEVIAAKRSRARKIEPYPPRVLPVSERTGFDAVEAGLTEEEAHIEAVRCLQCQAVCDKCVEVCPNRANVAYRTEPIDVAVPVLADRGGTLTEVGTDRVRIAQARQILHVDDLCNECGNCTTFCVHDGEPYRAKPRLFLHRSPFAAEGDNALFIGTNGETVHRRDGGEEYVLTLVADGFIYETSTVRLRLTREFRVVEGERKRPFDERVSLRPAVEMAALLLGIRSSAPHLLLPLSDGEQEGGLR
jgi:putative selenate reductase